MINREKTLNKEILYEGRIVTLELHDVQTDRGNLAKREIIRHAAGVVILGFTREERIILLRQFRKPFEEGVLELPAGKLEPGEDPLATAIREFQEETGYFPRSMEFLGEALTSPGYSDEVLYIYRARDLVESPLDGDEDESFEYYEMTREEVAASVRQGDLKDAKSLCALYLDGLNRDD